MSKEIDEKVVRMKFDNAEFEKNINQTIKSLKSLEDSLKLEDASEGLENVQKASKKIKMDRLEKGVTKVTARFDALSVVAATVLNRITNRAIDTGVSLVKSLSIDNIAAGWQKYETQLVTVGGIVNNVQDQFDSLAQTNAAVAESMAKLLSYADETSFSFASMSDGIRQFTVAGIELDKATSAAIGVTSLAGASKVFNRYKVQSAMDAISKSMSTGYVDLMRWTTLTNTAGIVTTEFSQALLDAAVAEGTLVKNQQGVYATLKTGEKVTTENIRNTLSSRWLNTDVLTSVLNRYSEGYELLGKYAEETNTTLSEVLDTVYDGEKILISAEDQIRMFGKELDILGLKALKSSQETSTFSQAIEATKEAVGTRFQKIFELLLGDTEEARVLWSDVANILYYTFVPALDSVTDVLTEWKSNGGFAVLSESITNIFEGFRNLVDIIRGAFSDVFGSGSLSGFTSFVEAFRDFTERAKNNEALLKTIGLLFKTLFSIFKIGGKAISAVLPLISSLLKLLEPFIDLASNILTYISSGLDVFSKWLSTIRVALPDLSGFGNILSGILYGIKKLFEWFKDTFLYKALVKLVNKIGEFFKQFKNLSAVEAFNKLSEKLKNSFTKFGNWFSNVIDKIKEKWGSLWTSIKEGYQRSGLKVVIDLIIGLLKDLWNKIKEVVSNISETIKSAIDPNKSNWENLLSILKSIGGILKGGLILFILLNIGRIFRSINWVIEGVSDFFAARKLNQIAKIILSIAAAIAAMGAVLFVIGRMNPDTMLKSAITSISLIVLLCGAMAGVAILINKYGMNERAWATGLLRPFIGMALVVSAASKMITTSKDVTLSSVGKTILLVTAMGAVVTAMQVILSKVRKSVSLFGILKILLLLKLLYSNLDIVLDALSKVEGRISKETIKTIAYISAILIAVSATMELILTLRGLNKGKRAVGIVKSAFDGLSAIVTLIVALVTFKSFKKIASNIGELDPKQILSVGKTIGIILGAFAVLIFIYNKSAKIITKDQRVGTGAKLGLTLVSIMASILIVLKAIKKANDMKLSDYENGIKNVIAIVVALTLLVGVLTLISKLNVKGGKVQNVFFSIALMLGAIIALKFISKEELERAKETLKQVGWLLTAYIGVILLLSTIAFINKKALDIEGIYKLLLSFALMFSAAIGSLFAINALIKQGADVTQLIGYMAEIMGVITACVVIIDYIDNKTTRIRSASFLKFISITGIFVVIVGTLIGAFYLLKDQPLDRFNAIGWALTGLISVISIVLIGLSNLTKTVNPSNFSGLLFLVGTITIIIGTLIGAFYLLKDQPLDRFNAIGWSLVGLISVVMLIISIFASFTSAVGKVNLNAALGFLVLFGSIVVIIGTLIGAVIAMKKLNVSAGDMAIVALVAGLMMAIITILSTVLFSLGKLDLKKSIAFLILMSSVAVAFLGIAASMLLLKDMDLDEVAKIAWTMFGIISILMVIMGALAALTAIPVFGQLFSGGLIVVGTVLASIAAVFLAIGGGVLLMATGLKVLLPLMSEIPAAVVEIYHLLTALGLLAVSLAVAMPSLVALPIQFGLLALSLKPLSKIAEKSTPALAGLTAFFQELRNMSNFIKDNGTGYINVLTKNIVDMLDQLSKFGEFSITIYPVLDVGYLAEQVSGLDASVSAALAASTGIGAGASKQAESRIESTAWGGDNYNVTLNVQTNNFDADTFIQTLDTIKATSGTSQRKKLFN